MKNRYIPSGLLFVALLVLPGSILLAHEEAGTLDKIAKSGEFIIGYRTDASPLSYENADGKPSGYSVDLCRRIAAAVKAHLGLDNIETKYMAISTDERLDAVNAGKVDIVCGSTTITMGRQEFVDFSLPIFVTGGSALSLTESGIKGMADLSGKKIGVGNKTTTAEQLRSYLTQNLIDAEVVIVKDRADGMKRLNDGDIDAFASDQIVLIGQVIEALYPKSYALMNETFSYEPYGLVVRKNDASFRLVVNKALTQLYGSGNHIQIYNKWIGRIGIRPSPILAAMYQLNTFPD
jgi:glutamate/aspartate transport system substrate-binding protein